jgi:hypothetical protein
MLRNTKILLIIPILNVICIVSFLALDLYSNSPGEPFVTRASFDSNFVSLITASQVSRKSPYREYTLREVIEEFKDADTRYWSISGLVIITVIVVGTLYWKEKCPACGKRWGLKNTGLVSSRPDGVERPTGILTWLIFSNDWVLFTCKACGYEKWRRRGRGGPVGAVWCIYL